MDGESSHTHLKRVLPIAENPVSNVITQEIRVFFSICPETFSLRLSVTTQELFLQIRSWFDTQRLANVLDVSVISLEVQSDFFFQLTMGDTAHVSRVDYGEII